MTYDDRVWYGTYSPGQMTSATTPDADVPPPGRVHTVSCPARPQATANILLCPPVPPTADRHHKSNSTSRQQTPGGLAWFRLQTIMGSCHSRQTEEALQVVGKIDDGKGGKDPQRNMFSVTWCNSASRRLID